MKKILKQFIKKLPFLYHVIRTIKYTPVNTKKLLKNINKYFSNLPTSLELFNKIPKVNNLIVSLTSFPARMEYIEYTIFSLIQQSIRPEKIILCLSEKEFINKENDLPKSIQRYYSFGLEIQFEKENYKSYNKLVFTLRKYPNHIIVTADDDIFYKKNWLKLLYKNHRLYPKNIISNKIRRITFYNKQLNPYLKWKNHSSSICTSISFLNFLLGYCGVLYPPNSLYKDAVNVSLFTDLCPHADDVWFFVMALLSNTKIIKPKYFFERYLSFDYQYTNKWKNVPQLMDTNLGENKNDVQLKAVLKYYGLDKSFYEKYA